MKFDEVETFGEKLLIALGVVALRAGQLDDYFCFFLSAALGHRQIGDVHMARALFFSTRSAKARHDMARAAIYVSKMSGARKEFALAILDRVEKVSERRNEFIHGQITHELQGKKDGTTAINQVLINFASAKKQPRKSRPLRLSEIEDLAMEYDEVKNRLWGFYADVVVRPLTELTENRMPSNGTPD